MASSERSKENSNDSESELKEFLSKIDKYECVIPNDVTSHILRSSGVAVSDDKISKLVSIAAQKFIVDIISDCFQLCKTKEVSNAVKKETQTSSNQFCLTYDDLECVLNERGIE
ncbi:hypothetical protein HZS_7754, partial [Henneguya salminicola]